MNNPMHFPVLRIILPNEDNWSELDWLGFGADRTWQTCGSSPLAEMPSSNELEILLPARHVSAHRLLLPAQVGKHLEAVVEQALEDRIIGDKTDALAILGREEGSTQHVWVCHRRWLESALEQLTAAGFYPSHLLPEYDLLPEAAGLCVCAETGGNMLFRTADGQFGIAPDETTLRRLTPDTPPLHVTDLHRQPPAPSSRRTPWPKSLARFTRQAFEPRLLYRPAALLSLSLLLLLLGAVIRWQQLESQEARLRHEIRQTFAAAFPGTPIVDPILQWESKQREVSQHGNDALDNVALLASRLNAPIHPRRIEAGDGFVRLILTDSEAAQFKGPLDAAGRPETSPAEPGSTRLSYQLQNRASR